MSLFTTNCGGVLAVLFVIFYLARVNADDDFLDASCTESKDCYVTDTLHLACWGNVRKCKCSNTFESPFHLKWQNKQCLMSKYGPCGEKGTDLIVGCQDGFVCIENQCRAPNDLMGTLVKRTPFIFDESDCFTSYCRFNDDLQLTCNDANQCECRKEYVADVSDNYWDIRNYDGENNCSAGKYGPCGTQNGITITCHGDGITCVSGTCLNASHPISDIGEDCAYNTNCKEGLQCSADSICIETHSLAEGALCTDDKQCQKGHECRSNGPWYNAFCAKVE